MNIEKQLLEAVIFNELETIISNYYRRTGEYPVLKPGSSLTQFFTQQLAERVLTHKDLIAHAADKFVIEKLQGVKVCLEPIYTESTDVSQFLKEESFPEKTT